MESTEVSSAVMYVKYECNLYANAAVKFASFEESNEVLLLFQSRVIEVSLDLASEWFLELYGEHCRQYFSYYVINIQLSV